MKSTCQRGVNSLCTQCGLFIPPRTIRACKAKVTGLSEQYSSSPTPKIVRKSVEPCPHFLGTIQGEEAKVFNCGCPAEQVNGITVGVCECDLYSRCIVWSTINTKTRIEPEGIRLCETCSDNPKNKL